MPRPTRIKVRGYHLDVYGHVNNARYLEFLEDARWDLLEGRIDLDGWRDRGLSFNVVRIAINYRKAASLGDVLEVGSSLAGLGERSGTIRQEIRFAGTADVVADAEVTFVIVDGRSERAIPLDGEVRDALSSLGRDDGPPGRDDGPPGRDDGPPGQSP